MLADLFGPDLLIVAIILVVLLFGGAAIPKLARNLGSAKTEFEKGIDEGKKGVVAKDVSVASDTPSTTVITTTPVPNEEKPAAS